MNRNHHITLLEALLDLVDFRNDRETEGGIFPIGKLAPGPLDPAFFVPPRVVVRDVIEEELFRWLKTVLHEFALEEMYATGFTSLRRLYYNNPSAQRRAVEVLGPAYQEPPPTLEELLFLAGPKAKKKAPIVREDASPGCAWVNEIDETESDEEIEYNVPRFTWPEEK